PREGGADGQANGGQRIERLQRAAKPARTGRSLRLSRCGRWRDRSCRTRREWAAILGGRNGFERFSEPQRVIFAGRLVFENGRRGSANARYGLPLRGGCA